MKINYLFFLFTLFGLLLVSGCTKQTYICSTGEQVATASLCPVCGDNKCTGLESDCNCPSDCHPPINGEVKVRNCANSEFPTWDSRTGGCTQYPSGCTQYPE